MSTHAKDVTMEVFEQVMETQPLVILDFWAEWCAPCKVFSPIFEELAELHPEIYFGKVNVEQAKDLAEAFQVKSIPTLIAFKDGDIFFEAAGIIPPQKLGALLEQLRA